MCPRLATLDGQRWSGKGCRGCCSHSRGHHLLPRGNRRDASTFPGPGRKQSIPFSPALMLLEDAIRFCAAQAPAAWSFLIAEVTQHRERSIRDLCFPPSFSWLSCVAEEISQKTQEHACDGLWEMSSPHFLPPGACPTHHHHLLTAPLVSLLAPGSKRSRQKINHHFCLKTHISFSRFASRLSHR